MKLCDIVVVVQLFLHGNITILLTVLSAVCSKSDVEVITNTYFVADLFF